MGETRSPRAMTEKQSSEVGYGPSDAARHFEALLRAHTEEQLVQLWKEIYVSNGVIAALFTGFAFGLEPLDASSDAVWGSRGGLGSDIHAVTAFLAFLFGIVSTMYSVFEYGGLCRIPTAVVKEYFRSKGMLRTFAIWIFVAMNLTLSTIALMLRVSLLYTAWVTWLCFGLVSLPSDKIYKRLLVEQAGKCASPITAASG